MSDKFSKDNIVSLCIKLYRRDAKKEDCGSTFHGTRRRFP